MEKGRADRPLAGGRRRTKNGSTVMKLLFAVALSMAALTAGARAQDVAAGEQSFKKCLPCHSIGEGAKNKVGPVLNGLDGRHSGSMPDYSYSDANMIFPGIKNEKEAGDLWAYLKQFGPDGNKK